MKIEFNINDRTYKIAGLTVYDHYHVQNEMLLNPHASFAVVSYLSDCDEELLRQLDVYEWNGLWTVVQQFLKESLSPKDGINKILKVNGVKYMLTDMDKMSIGEFADLDIIVSSPGADRRIHEVAAILYRPIVDGQAETYSTDSFKQRAEEFKSLPLTEAMKCLNFFLLSGLQSLNNIVDYLEILLMEEMMTPEQEEIVQTTHKQLREAGIKLSSSSPTKTSWTLKEWQAWESKLPSIGLRISKTKSESKSSLFNKFVKNISLN